MNNLEMILTQFQDIATSPEKQFKLALSEGRKVIGCFPIYTPEPLIYAAGMLPFGMWGGDIEIFQAKKYLPAFACPIMQINLENGLTGVYKGVSAVLIPTVCDTFRCITQDWKAGVNNIPMIPVAYPQNHNEAGIDFFVSELKRIKSQLEKISGAIITEEQITTAIEMYNEYYQTMRDFVKLANEHLDVVTPSVRHAIIKSGWFLDKKIHMALVRALNGELKKLTIYKGNEKKILLTGIMAEPLDFYKILEENNMVVVADDLGQETRQFRYAIPIDKDPLTNLSCHWAIRKDSTSHSSHKERIEEMVNLAKETNVDGVIACMMKFCDPEEYDYPYIKKEMNAIGIPVLYQEIDLQTSSLGQARTRIQTFGEML